MDRRPMGSSCYIRQDTWRDGDVELNVPVWTHHMRYNDDQDLIDDFNEFPAGIGLGKGRYNASGSWEGMYAMGFLDAHSKPSLMAGCAWVPTWQSSRNDGNVLFVWGKWTLN